MNFFTFTKEELKTKNAFKFLIALLSVNLIWVVYELFKYTQYLSDNKFLLDLMRWEEVAIIENIMYLFAHFTGIIGVLTFIFALIKLVKGQCAIKMLINSFLFQLISCITLFIDSVFMVTLSTYMQGMTYAEKYFSVFTSILLIVTLFALLFYVAKVGTKKIAIVSAITMTLVNIAVILYLFIFKLNIATEFFLTLSLSIKILYILISIATLITIIYTEFKDKRK